uniref:glucuronosyltransferase n=1 Tax=Sphaeramia orbicularis TaxID=375764 RepID=A0A672YZC1_9TELE
MRTIERLTSLGLLAWFCCLSAEPVQGGKVLVMPVDGSHWLSMKILVKELSLRGHEVVVLVPESSLLIQGSDSYRTEVFTVSYSQQELDANFNELRKGIFVPPKSTDFLLDIQRLIDFTNLQVRGCESLLHNEALMSRLRAEGFDVLLTDPFLPCGSVLAHLFSIPAVYFLRGLPCGLDLKANQCPTPLSYIPKFYSGNTPQMNFPQRVKNVFFSFVESYLCKLLYANFDYLASKYLEDGMTYKELISHGAVWLLRYDFTFEWPRPLMPNMVLIGGINCAKKGPLPAVVWRYTGVPPTDVPENVRLMKWLPQNDLLAHPKAQIFFTHGGTHGVYEGICNAVPMVMFPLFGDQGDNVHRMVARGVAEKLSMLEVTSETVVATIRKLINDKSYKQKMVQLSQIHLDRPLQPLDLAVFWTEFVMKHKGAAHLRVAAHDLNWIQYHSLDVLGFLSLVLITVLVLTLKCCWFCTRSCFRKRTEKRKSQ